MHRNFLDGPKTHNLESSDYAIDAYPNLQTKSRKMYLKNILLLVFYH